MRGLAPSCTRRRVLSGNRAAAVSEGCRGVPCHVLSAQLRSNVLDFSRLSLYGSEVSMAHIAKYKAPSVGHMLAHYRRDRSSLERDNGTYVMKEYCKTAAFDARQAAQ